MRWKPRPELLPDVGGFVVAILVFPVAALWYIGSAAYDAKKAMFGPTTDWSPWFAWRPVFGWDIQQNIWLEWIFRRRRYMTEYSTVATSDKIDPEEG